MMSFKSINLMTNNLFVSVCSFSVDEDEESSKYSSPSFYVADDEKSIAIVDLLEYGKFKTMTVQFYLNLLKDLTDMIKVEECEEITGEKNPTVETNRHEIIEFVIEENNLGHAKNKDTLESLLDMEFELDETMRKIRKGLMVIRLIGLMSEDEKLQNALMQDSGQMIEVRWLTYLYVSQFYF